MENHETKTGSCLTGKDRIDTLLALADASWRDFDARRSTEWKLTIGLWTAQALFAGLVLRSDVKLVLSTPQLFVLAAIFLAIVAVYCCWWTKGLRDRNAANLEDAHYYWNLAEMELGIESARYGRARERPRSHWANWSHGSQMATTLLLAAVDFWCIWAKHALGPQH